MVKPIYTARAVRNGRWWAIDIRELRSVHSQSRRLDQVEQMAREVIGLALQAPPDTFDVSVQVDFPSLGALQVPVEAALRAREAAELAQHRASDAMRTAITEIRSAGYTARDAGMLLGVSNQRISQIEHELAQDSRTARSETA